MEDKKPECLLCSAKCDGSHELFLNLNPGRWAFWAKRRVKIGEICVTCIERIAPSQFRELLKRGEWLRNLR